MKGPARKTSEAVYRRSDRKDMGEFSLDAMMLNVLMELDGRSSVAQVAERLRRPAREVEGLIARLLKLKLVEPVEGGRVLGAKEFFRMLTAQMSLAVGPIAQILVEDALAEMGLVQPAFPLGRAAELVDHLAREIQREDKRMVFKRNMLEWMKNGA